MLQGASDAAEEEARNSFSCLGHFCSEDDDGRAMAVGACGAIPLPFGDRHASRLTDAARLPTVRRSGATGAFLLTLQNRADANVAFRSGRLPVLRDAAPARARRVA